MSLYFFLSIVFLLLSLATARYKTKHLIYVLLNTLSIFCYLLITVLYFSADYFTNEGINDAVLYTVEYGLGGAGFGEYTLLLFFSFFFFVVVFALSYLYFRIIHNSIIPKPKRLKGFLHNSFLVLAFIAHPFTIDFYAIYQAHNPSSSDDFGAYYGRVEPTTLTPPESPMSVVYIYAESLEQTYFDPTLFPHLVENLSQLKATGRVFSNIQQLPSTGWTIAGMSATQCGLPLFTNSGGNSMGNAEAFLSGAVCLGDLLKGVGYGLVFMQGSSTYFSGIHQLYKTHGFDEIVGREELLPQLHDTTYLNGWGLYDDTLLDLAYEKFVTLSQSAKPFGLFLATMDTHHPRGHLSHSCEDRRYQSGENSILNAVHCSDYLLSRFIEKIQNSPYGKRTIIVLTSDHLAMRNTATPLLQKAKERRDLFVILDPRDTHPLTIDQNASMLDVPSTLLHTLGIAASVGLGRDLLLDRSLSERFTNFPQKLLSWREDILGLWEFPHLLEQYRIDPKRQTLSIGHTTYHYPLLLRIGANRAIRPIFESFSTKKLIEYLEGLLPSEKFIWVDRCRRINQIFGHENSERFCIAQGDLMGRMEVRGVGREPMVVESGDLLALHSTEPSAYEQRLQHLREINCQPKQGELTLSSVSRPTLEDISGGIRFFNEHLYLSRGLNLLTRNAQGSYHIAYFDTYASETATEEFLVAIEALIAQKKFWAVVAYDALNNTHPHYQERLRSLGFTLLPTLNFRVAYVAYAKGEHMIESSHPERICKRVVMENLK